MLKNKKILNLLKIFNYSVPDDEITHYCNYIELAYSVNELGNIYIHDNVAIGILNKLRNIRIIKVLRSILKTFATS